MKLPVSKREPFKEIRRIHVKREAMETVREMKKRQRKGLPVPMVEYIVVIVE